MNRKEHTEMKNTWKAIVAGADPHRLRQYGRKYDNNHSHDSSRSSIDR